MLGDGFSSRHKVYTHKVTIFKEFEMFLSKFTISNSFERRTVNCVSVSKKKKFAFKLWFFSVIFFFFVSTDSSFQIGEDNRTVTVFFFFFLSFNHFF